jgi:hypothetical protein
MAAWLRHYGTERDSAPDVQQLLWPDQNGRFPDDPLFDRELRRQQPLLSADPYRYPKPYVPRSQGRHRKRRR